MPLRDKLKKVFHRDHEGSADSSPRASQDSPRNAPSPRSGQRPLSTTGDKLAAGNGQSQGSPVGGRRTSAAIPSLPGSNVDHQTSSSNSGRRSEDVMSHARIPGTKQSARYSEDVADWNLVQANKTNEKSAVPAPLQVNKDSGEYSNQFATDRNPQRTEAAATGHARYGSASLSQGRSRGDSVSRKAVAGSPIGVAVTSSSAITPDKSGHHLDRKTSASDLRKRASLDQPAAAPPTVPADLPVRDMAASEHVKNYAVKDAAVAPSLTGIVDLTNTVDTTVEERWAPAVVHENVRKEFHHIREEVITREIHNYDIFHRILPVIDVEVLPTRHFVPDGKGGLIEISENEIPGRTGPYKEHWTIVENVSTGVINREPRRFTAREFHGDEGNYKEYISDKGVKTTETTWIHPPTLAKYGELSGQTVPFYFNSPDPRHDGLRIHAPRGPVSGVSHMYAEQAHRPLTPPSEEMNNLSLNGNASTMKSKRLSSGILTPPHTATGDGFPRDIEDPRLATA